MCRGRYLVANRPISSGEVRAGAKGVQCCGRNVVSARFSEMAQAAAMCCSAEPMCARTQPCWISGHSSRPHELPSNCTQPFVTTVLPYSHTLCNTCAACMIMQHDSTGIRYIKLESHAILSAKDGGWPVGFQQHIVIIIQCHHHMLRHMLQVVLVSAPFLTAILPSHKKRVCHHCLADHRKRLTLSCSEWPPVCHAHARTRARARTHTH